MNMIRIPGLLTMAFLFGLGFTLSSQNAGQLANRQLLHYGVEDGLSQGSVFGMLKDSRGFMWFTSYEGLNRFDGIHFKVYHADPNDTIALRGNQTIGLVEDPYGNIWVGTETCLNRYQRERDHFDFVYALGQNGELEPSIHYPFYADSSNVWYINEVEGLVAFDFHRKEKRIISSHFRYSWSASIINSTLRGYDGFIWIRQEKGLARVNPLTGEARYYFSANPDNRLGPALPLICHLSVSDSSLWLGVQGGLIHFEPALDRWQHYPIDTLVSFADLQQRPDGLLYLGTEDDGLFLFDPSIGVIGQLTAQNSTLKNLSTASLYLDDEQILWINTDPEGINVLYPAKQGFEVYNNHFFEEKGFVSPSIRCFAEAANEEIWVGAEEDGLFVFDPISKQVVRHFRPNGSHGLRENHASSLLIDSKDHIWVGTGNSLFHSEDGQSFSLVPHEETGTPDRVGFHVWDILETPEGYYFFATTSGLYFSPPGAERAYQLDALQNISTGDIELLGDWLLVPGHHRGFWAFNYRKWIDSDQQTLDVQHVFQEYNIKHFAPQGDSVLWLATTSGLLKLQFDASTMAVRLLNRYGKADGLASEYLYGILWDESGRMWISSNRGLVQFDPAQEHFRLFGLDDQIQGFEFNTNAYLKTTSNHLLFGGTQGFNFFRPPIDGNPALPSVQLTELYVNGQLRQTPSYIGELASLELPYQDNTFTLHFRAVDFLSKGRNSYRIRLRGYDQDWVDLGQQDEIRYTRVPPGRYTFEVIAANNDGLWAEDARRLTIRILPPWWASWWAYLIYALLIAMIGLTAWRFQQRRRRLRGQLQREQAEAHRLKELDEFKSKVFTHITHEFRTPLTVIMGLSEELRARAPKHHQDQLGRIWSNGDALLSLVNQMLEMAKLQAGHWPERLEEHDLHTFLQLQLDARMDQAHAKHISLQLQLQEPSQRLRFDRNKWERILANLLDNALHFTPEYGQVSLQVTGQPRASDGEVILDLRDTGIGMPATVKEHIFDTYFIGPGSKGTGIGLALVKELVDSLSGRVEVQSTPGEGTRFILALPVLAASGNPPSPVPVPSLTTDSTQEEDQAVLLVAEDNPDVVFYLRSILAEEWQLLIARNGEDAWALASEQIPDLVLSDVMMPGIDGFELCRLIKEDHRTSHIPVLLLTAKAESAATLTGLQRGADAYLTKPIHKEELLQRLRNFLRLQRQNHAHWQQLDHEPGEADRPAPPEESAFLEQLNTVLEKHLADTELQISFVCRLLGLSRTQLHRKLKAITGLPTSRYIRRYRLQRARQLLQSTDLPVSEIAYQTGFDNLSWFSQAYREAYGQTPSASRQRS